MANKNAFVFFENTDSVGDSSPLSVSDASALTFEVQVLSGTPVFSINVVAIVDQFNTKYTPIVYSPTITAEGNYIIAVLGYSLVKARINEISGGNIKVFGRLTG